MQTIDHPEFSVEWLARVFDLGRPRVAVHAGCGQKNPLGVLRLETTKGCFAVKRFEQEPSHVALAIESAAYATRFPMPQPLRDRKSTRLNSSHLGISYAVFC